ncbi:lipase family protein [Nocardia sp. A7]|uniref:lipase family protein n=1 Tax=Nocardia sp. A7 TaxID=2789274 RepID=UPI0039782818
MAKGTILRARRVQIAAFGLIRQRDVSAWQLLYVSSDLRGNPEATVTTVLTAKNATPDPNRPLIAFQCAIDAVADQCFPSYALRHGARSFGANPHFEYFMIACLLQRGWAVSVADHEGLDGRFGAPREPGYRGLDGVRAALDFAPLGLDATTRVAIWGYSGGGMAGAWMAEMAATYAGLVATGDTLITGHPVSRMSGPQVLPDDFSCSRDENLATLELLEDLDADLIIPGHGEPWCGPIRKAVLAARRNA